MTLQEMICPGCEHRCFTDCHYVTCAACGRLYYAADSLTCKKRPPSQFQTVWPYQPPPAQPYPNLHITGIAPGPTGVFVPNAAAGGNVVNFNGGTITHTEYFPNKGPDCRGHLLIQQIACAGGAH